MTITIQRKHHFFSSSSTGFSSFVFASTLRSRAAFVTARLRLQPFEGLSFLAL